MGLRMKKIFIVFCLMLSTLTYATDWNSTAAINRVNNIGSKILKANNVVQPIQFKVSSEDTVNAYADINKEIHVYKGLLDNVETDDELAGVISHEMGHIINGHCAKQGIVNAGIIGVTSIMQNAIAKSITQELATSKVSRNDEFEADLTGIDLMTKANYDPKAMISLLNKISSSYIDFASSHPSGEKRLLNIYNYIEYNYPQKLKTTYNTTSYKNALLVLNPTVEQRKASKRLSAKYERQQKKLLAKKEKRMKKMSRYNSVWDSYYTSLQMISGN